jgi:L-methionine (R)-S-oxide reductase
MFESLKTHVAVILQDQSQTRDERLQAVCETLRNNLDHYDWVGFYFHNGDKPELILGPYAGDTTDHTVIPFGKGICGQVALSNSNFIVPDVTAQDNYLSCSIHVKAEIVVPIFLNGRNIGQIDIDSRTLNPFTAQDEQFLEWVCEAVAKIL